MAVKNRRQLKLPRSVLATIAKDNPQAIKTLENMQEASLIELPDGLQQVLEQSYASSMQAETIANQAMEQLSPYLVPVSVPAESNPQLSAVNMPCDYNNYLVSV